MKNLFCAFVGGFLIMFFIWVLVAWINYPDFMTNRGNYHLNLYAMLQRFNQTSYQNDFIYIFRSMIQSLRKVNVDNPIVKSITSKFATGAFVGTSGVLVLSLLNSLLNPFMLIANTILLTGYLLVLLVNFIALVTSLLVGIYSFVFEPIFIITT